MKVKYVLMLSLLAVLSSCSDKKQTDAYGNFEDDALIVSAESAGEIILFTAKEGQTLQSSQVVGLIDTMQLYFKKEVLQASMTSIDSKARNVEAQISVLEEQLEIQQINQKRIEKMFNDGAATQKQLDDINSQVKITEQKIKNIKTQSQSVLSEKRSMIAQIKQIDDLIQKNIIKSPITGTVLETFVKQNEFAAPGKPLFSIQNVNDLTLRAYVSETQLTQIKINQKVKVEVDYANEIKEYPGQIYWISDKAEFTPKQIQTKEERRNLIYAIKIRVENKNGELKIGMPASLNFD